MRRIPAIFLLVLFSGSLIVPVLAAGADSKLPACCRKEGQHRCAMTGTPSEAGMLIQAACPAYSKTGAAPAYSKLAGIRPARGVVAQIASEAAVHAQTEALARVSFSRTRQKRGPPSTLLS